LPILKTNKNTLGLLKEITMVKHIKIHLTRTEHYRIIRKSVKSILLRLRLKQLIELKSKSAGR